MLGTSKRTRLVVTSAVCIVWALAAPAVADVVTYLPKGSTWKYFRPLDGISHPDPTAWQKPDFDDGAWQTAAAPFGYGDESRIAYGLNLGTLDPPMQANHSSLLMRGTFETADPDRVVMLRANVNYDDGLVLWINGTELLRHNVEGAIGDPTPFDDVANSSHEAAQYEEFDLPDPEAYLVQGTNVVGVLAYNVSVGSGDFAIDVELVDPFGPDLLPPTAAQVTPPAGLTLRTLKRVEVTFSERVSGVDAGDLLVNGSPAQRVEGLGPGPYEFTFKEPAPGPVTMAWAAAHGITDEAEVPNLFAGGQWTYTIDPSIQLPDVTVTEILASNRTGLLDEDRETEDWIELRNRSDVEAKLGAWSLTDRKENAGKWVFPDVTIPPGGYLVVFASGKDRRPENGQLHTNFKLNAGGEYLGLYPWDAPEPVFEFEPQEEDGPPEFPQQRSDISFGLSAGGQWGYLDPPTPGEPNGDALRFEGFVADPTFSPEHSLVAGADTSVNVAIGSATPGARIYYTLDWTEPSEENGSLYEAPIQAAGRPERPSLVVRAIAYKDGYLPSNSVTATYVFLDSVPKQARFPDGFPRSWPNGHGADYEMDPEIVNNAVYTADLGKGLVAIPTVSLVTAIGNLFDAQRGIYAHPTSSGVTWERPISAELIFPSGRKGFQINCGLRIQGGASRQPEKSPKHGFRLLFKGDYGPTKLRFPLFADSSVARFDTLILRGNFNNSWIHWDGGQRSRCQHIHDQFFRDTQRDMGQVASHGIFVQLYINGVYWGMYNVVERPTAPFAADHFGGDKEQYDALNYGELRDGTMAAWQELQARINRPLTDLDNYVAVENFLDIPAYCDYMILNLYGSNQDWAHHNWYANRRREPPGLWRFFSWDAERTLENVSDSSRINEARGAALAYSKLRANAEFRLAFADRVHRHFFNNGALIPEAVEARWKVRSEEVVNACVPESARWGDYRRDVHSWRNPPYELYTRDNQLKREENRLLTQHFPRRSSIVLNQFRSVQLYPRVGAPVFNQHGGTIQPGFQLLMSLPDGTNGTIHYTTDGSDPREFGTGAVSPEALEYGGGEPVVLNDPTHVKARTRDGTTWSALNEAVFTIPRPLDALRVTEIMYHPADAGTVEPDEYEFLELKNTATHILDVTGVTIANGITFAFPEGTIIKPQAFLVLVANDAAFSEKYPGVVISGMYRGKFSNAGDTIEIKDPARTVLASITYSDLAPWPEEADGFGYSLVPKDPAGGGDPNDPTSWRVSTFLDGSPGADDTPQTPTAPRITAQPQDVTATVGEPATFVAAATGHPAPEYQWQRDQQDIPGATGNAYALAQVTMGDNGARFRCVIANAAGSVTTNEAVLTVLLPVAPSIDEQPGDVAVTEGETATFTVVATARPEPSYQWQRNGEDIPAAVKSSYTTQPTSLDDDGARFRCVVANSEGSLASREAVLTVLPAPKPYRRGDSNDDAQINIADAVHMLEVLFLGKQRGCDATGDVNDDGRANIADPVALLSYIFAIGPRPNEPFAGCGFDPTPDSLECREYTSCAQ